MIVGVGIDVVAVSRFAQALDRTPALAERTFTPAERMTAGGRPRSAESLAARFAAKEAIAKALGAPGGLRWHDAEITAAEHGRPAIAVRGTVAALARALGVTRWHLSLSHDAGIASAVVVAEASDSAPVPPGTGVAPGTGMAPGTAVAQRSGASGSVVAESGPVAASGSVAAGEHVSGGGVPADRATDGST